MVKKPLIRPSFRERYGTAGVGWESPWRQIEVHFHLQAKVLPTCIAVCLAGARHVWGIGTSLLVFEKMGWVRNSKRIYESCCWVFEVWPGFFPVLMCLEFCLYICFLFQTNTYKSTCICFISIHVFIFLVYICTNTRHIYMYLFLKLSLIWEGWMPCTLND